MEQLFFNDLLIVLFLGLPLLMLVDIITAWISASITGQLNSLSNSAGYKKKALMLVVLAAFVGTDLTIFVALQHFNIETFSFAGVEFSQLPLFTFVVLVWQNVGELLSILENLDKAGVSMPGWIKRVLRNVKSKLDDYDITNKRNK